MEASRDEGVPATNYSPENCMRIINGFSRQLTDIFEAGNPAEENAILKGFVILVQSRIQAMVEAHFATGLEQARSDIEPKSLLYAIRVLQLTWDRIWYPIYCQFNGQRDTLAIEWTRSTSKNYPEIRRLTSKVKKFSDSVTDFYMIIIQLVQKNINTNHIVPKFATNLLKIETTDEMKSNMIQKPSDRLAFLVNAIYHSNMFYLGCLNRSKAVCSRFNDKYTLEDFNVSIQYFDAAILLNSYLGRYFYQKSFVYLTLNDDPTYCFNNVLAHLAPGRCSTAILQIRSIFYERNSDRHMHIREVLKDIHQADLFSSKIVNREIIGYYTLALIGLNLNKDVWLDRDSDEKKGNMQTIMGIGIKHMELALNERLGTRYIKNIDLIYQNLITVIGCYHLIDDLNVVCSKNGIKQHKRTYLKFASSYMMTILDRVIIAGWEKSLETYQYLAMARIMLDWIHTNDDVHKCITKIEEFMQLLATLVNKLNASKYMAYEEIKSGIPITYLLEEDLLPHTLKFLVKPFNELDGKIMMESKDKCNRICGQVVETDGDGDDGKLPKEEEAVIRMKSIIVMVKKLLSDNTHDINWDESAAKYVFTKIRRNNFNNNIENSLINKNNNKTDSLTGGKQRGIFSKASLKKIDSENKKPDALEQLIKRRGLGVSQMPVYSGSSVVAPESFTTKPTLAFTGVEESGKESGEGDEEVTARSSTDDNDSIVGTTEGKDTVMEHLEKDAPLDMATIESALRELTNQENDSVSTPYYQNESVEQGSLPTESQPSATSSVPTTTYPNNANQSQAMFKMPYLNMNPMNNNNYGPPTSSTGSIYGENVTAPFLPPGMAPPIPQNSGMRFMTDPHGLSGAAPSVPPGMNLGTTHLNYPQWGNNRFVNFDGASQSNMAVHNLQNMMWQNRLYMAHPPPQSSSQQQQQQQQQYYPYGNMNNKPQW
ncbi:Translation inhibition and nonsense-mediated decay [Maudiozyma exigua]|uniref:Translation inhibition and nonsense-mediated decay n=1 Tax=Maudiozyma exigua TaxID=34358 RepID=A0A9P6WE00_MAUEX|nr:Translation inhibition and nonsense-mediated decay [Kazachstania exigua]